MNGNSAFELAKACIAKMPGRLDTCQKALDTLSESLVEMPRETLISELEAALRTMHSLNSTLFLADWIGVHIAPESRERYQALASGFALVEAYVLGPVPAPPATLPAPANTEEMARMLATLPDTVRKSVFAGSLTLSAPENAFVFRHAAKLCPPKELPAEPVFDTPTQVLAMARQFFTSGNTIGPFVRRLLDRGHVHFIDSGHLPAPASVVLEYGALPHLVIPFDNTILTLNHLSHHFGHSFHQYQTQNNHSPLAPLLADIDEAIPVLFELRLEEKLAQTRPEMATALQAARQADIDRYVTLYTAQMAALETPESVAEIASRYGVEAETLLSVNPPILPSYAYGALLAQAFSKAHGWNEARILELAKRGATARSADFLA